MRLSQYTDIPAHLGGGAARFTTAREDELYCIGQIQRHGCLESVAMADIVPTHYPDRLPGAVYHDGDEYRPSRAEREQLAWEAEQLERRIEQDRKSNEEWEQREREINEERARIHAEQRERDDAIREAETVAKELAASRIKRAMAQSERTMATERARLSALRGATRIAYAKGDSVILHNPAAPEIDGTIAVCEGFWQDMTHPLSGEPVKVMVEYYSLNTGARGFEDLMLCEKLAA